MSIYTQIHSPYEWFYANPSAPMVYHYVLEMMNAIDQQSSPFRRLYTFGLRFVSCFDSADHHVSPGPSHPEFIM
jgi:hypothetical protein